MTEAVFLDRQAEIAAKRRAWLAEQIAQDLEVLDGLPGAPAGTNPKVPGERSGGLQKLLLSLGGFSLIIAVLLGAALLWQRTNDLGRSAILIVAMIALLASGTRLLAYSRLRQTGSTLVIVGFVLAYVNVLYIMPRAVPAIEWWGSRWPSAYPAVATAALAVAAWWAARRWRSLAWLVMSALSGAGTALFAYLSVQAWLSQTDKLLDIAWPLLSAGAVTLALLFVWVALRRNRTNPEKEEELAAVQWAKHERDSLFFPAAALAILSLSALTVIQAARDWGPWTAWMAALLTVGAVLVTLFAGTTGLPRATLLRLVLALAGAWILASPAVLTLPLPVAAGAAAAWAAIFLNVRAPLSPRGGQVPLWVRMTGAAIIAFGWILAALMIVPNAPDTDLQRAVIAFTALASLGIYTLAWGRPRYPWAAWVAVLPGSTAALLSVDLLSVSQGPVERWSLPVAAILAIAGATWWWQERSARTLTTVGPAVTAALLPAAFTCWQFQDFDWPRAIIVLTASLILIVLGLRLRLGGLFYPGIATIIVILPAIIWVIQEPWPRWILFAFVGAALIIVAARLEWLRNQYSHWAHGYADFR